jgi:hypothetical protein
VIVTLLGKIKGEHHDLAHLVPCVPTTGSGIDVRRSLERFLDFKETQSLIDGPAISHVNGQAYKTRNIDDRFHDVLKDLFVTNHSLFLNHIASTQMPRERYQVFRSYRKSSDSRALAQEVSPTTLTSSTVGKLARIATSFIPKEARASKSILLLINCITIYFISIREDHPLQRFVAQNSRGKREKEKSEAKQ